MSLNEGLQKDTYTEMDMRCLYNVRGNKVIKVIACTRNGGDRTDGALSLQALNCIGVINAGFG